MILTSFHPNQSDYYYAEVPTWENEIESILSSDDKNFDAIGNNPNLLVPPTMSAIKSPFKNK